MSPASQVFSTNIKYEKSEIKTMIIGKLWLWKNSGGMGVWAPFHVTATAIETTAIDS